MRAVRVSGRTGFVESTLFWFLVSAPQKAGYIECILNSPCLDQSFSVSRESGRGFQHH